MFTGLIEEVGEIRSIRRVPAGLKAEVACGKILEGTRPGDSICVNGVCLTAAEVSKAYFCADIVEATLRATNLGKMRAGERVNLERALHPGSRLGGHFVTGHVDSTVRIITARGGVLRVRVPRNLEVYLFPTASIALDGVSLTVQKASPGAVEIALIPHTLANTNLGGRKAGSVVNIEVDILAKQVVSLIGRHNTGRTK